jgi:hypothetical protein
VEFSESKYFFSPDGFPAGVMTQKNARDVSGVGLTAFSNGGDK